MGLMLGKALVLAFAMAVAASSAALAQRQPPGADDRSTAPNAGAVLPPNAPKELTGKERLGRKWMDEQRIDNCKVPTDRHGTKPRPSTCAAVPTG
jgi:hypothetical protein